MSDELLIVRAQLGERAALAELVARWRVPVWTYVRRMLDAERADDVSQEIWLAVVRGLPRLREPERFAPWLFTIARRSITDRLRGQYAREQETLTPAGNTFTGDTFTEDQVEAMVDRAVLVEALARLPLPEREVLVLHYLEDLPVADCAHICQVPAGTIKSRLSRARRLLRTCLEEGDRS
ncbi:RNA polymerase sigma factor [[Actinomadura] parvosata subsp. kistnae]|uniref:RNA polymerase subunit sigma-24 n=1 Tax=[Actinomadura] parvosata subsp. kistnae TaxID=1909395 RepID=A0A1U9ZXI5_9ACTN|nr:sigma-70 family RNA polymerase sigma factor [Nonomuraea sp. ATCC 55076]AQZ62666.1 RNA polymerase subunit sigma-24 [Nonomuraea sp. ATCC 55076]SPL88967.1 RNA polymerase sigma factor [Actinomadura parvosata subsp. kistnae]